MAMQEHNNVSGEKFPAGSRRSYWKLCVDGASRNNPGPSGIGIYLLKNDQVVLSKGFFVGVKTNNQAEYLALLVGLFFIQKHAHAQDFVEVVSDSLLLVRQLQGRYRVKNEQLQLLFRAVGDIMHRFNCSISHVLREFNTHADAMANFGIDQKKQLPAQIVAFLNNYNIVP